MDPSLVLVHLFPSAGTIVLESSSYALVIRACSLSTARLKNVPYLGVTLDFLPSSECHLLHDNDVGHESATVLCEGCVGLVALEGEIFVVVITGHELCTPASATAPAFRVVSTEFHALSGNPSLHPSAHHRSHPAHLLRNTLSNKNFYHSPASDLSSRLHTRAIAGHTAAARVFALPATPMTNAHATRTESSDLAVDPNYVFNLHLLSALLAFRQRLVPADKAVFDRAAFAVPLVQGFVGASKVVLGPEREMGMLTVVSRLHWRRTGTRYNCRGIDDEGHVAQHAETETILTTGAKSYSSVIVRGSVPLKWTETPSKVRVILGVTPGTSYAPFQAHFFSLFDAYDHVHCINLMASSLSGKHGAEGRLGKAYGDMVDLAHADAEEEEFRQRLSYEEFDWSEDTALEGLRQMPKLLRLGVGKLVESFGATVVVDGPGGVSSVLEQQRGVFRVNCRDCCDRTGAGQALLAEFALDRYVQSHGILPSLSGSELEVDLRALWAENNDALSVAYVGTGAMLSHFTRTGEVSLADSVGRAITWEHRIKMWKERDAARQVGIDMLVGQGIYKGTAVPMAESEEFLARNPQARRYRP